MPLLRRSSAQRGEITGMHSSRALVGALMGALLLGSTGATAAAGRVGGPIDVAEECSIEDEVGSFGLGFAGITDDGSDIQLDVLVLRQGITRTEAAETMTKVAEMYEPLEIELNVRYQRMPGPVPTSIRDIELIQLSKDAVGGARPDGTDVVYTITTTDLTDSFQSSVTAGRADCIGGVRYPHRAFAVGESEDDPFPYPPFTFMEDLPAKIAAHEIGHLLGSAHEYSNCAEGSDTEPTDDALGVCTVMFPDISLIGSDFGTIEGAVIRSYAVRYATP